MKSGSSTKRSFLSNPEPAKPASQMNGKSSTTKARPQSTSLISGSVNWLNSFWIMSHKSLNWDSNYKVAHLRFNTKAKLANWIWRSISTNNRFPNWQSKSMNINQGFKFWSKSHQEKGQAQGKMGKLMNYATSWHH